MILNESEEYLDKRIRELEGEIYNLRNAVVGLASSLKVLTCDHCFCKKRFRYDSVNQATAYCCECGTWSKN